MIIVRANIKLQRIVKANASSLFQYISAVCRPEYVYYLFIYLFIFYIYTLAKLAPYVHKNCNIEMRLAISSIIMVFEANESEIFPSSCLFLRSLDTVCLSFQHN